MPIDPRIILGIQAPQFKVNDTLESAHKSLALQALMGQQDMQAMQMRQAQQAEADDLATREAFKAGGDRAAIVQRLMQSGQYKPAQALEKYGLEADKTRGEINKTRIEGMGKLLDFQKQAAGAVLANPTAENALQMIDQGERLATSLNFPEQAAAAAQQRAQVQALANDPEGLRRLVAGWAISADKLLPQFQTRNTGGSTDTLAIDPVTGKVSVTNTVANTATPDAIMTDKRTREEGALNRGVTIRGQNMTDARARETLDRGRWSNNFTEGYQVNMDTGETRPITTNGQPVMKEPKLTEDQGKATAWLVQADNGYRNMVAAMKATKGSAAKPGLPDVVAGVPSFGVGESAANILRGAERQKFLQGASSVSEALLRAATGAGINESEAKQKIAEITPKVGDSDAVIKQKLEAIPLFIETLKVRAGPGAGKLSAIREAGAAQRSPGRAASGPITQRNVTVDF